MQSTGHRAAVGTRGEVRCDQSNQRQSQLHDLMPAALMLPDGVAALPAQPGEHGESLTEVATLRYLDQWHGETGAPGGSLDGDFSGETQVYSTVHS